MNFKDSESEQKLRGGYYTPEDIATYISRWVLQSRPKNILEPSCGDGVFVKAIFNTGLADGVCFSGFELHKDEAEKAQCLSESLNVESEIKVCDFLGWSIPHIVSETALYDGVVGNPPFIRYQYLPSEAQEKSEAIFKKLGLKFTKHTNAWVPFVLAAISLLRPGGRLGMVLPAEIIHVMHAQSLRDFLIEHCEKILLIDPEEIWFESTLQGAVILLAEKKISSATPSRGLGIQHVYGREFLSQDPCELFSSVEALSGEAVSGKWTKALLSHEEREAYDRVCSFDEVYEFDSVATVDVGIVTGANKFFLVEDSVVEEFELYDYAYPMFGRSEHCPGIIYDKAQHIRNSQKGNPTNFIWIQGELSALPGRVRDYISFGEAQSLHTRYKCKVRSPWYTVPSVRSSQIGMLKRCHDTPKLILNEAGAYTTDTAYRIAVAGHISPEKLVYCFANALTALSAELEGRYYGGGVLELVPSEIERLKLVIPSRLKSYNVFELDQFVRREKAAVVLERQSEAVLGAIGVSEQDQLALLNAWRRMKNRRQRISSKN